MSGIINRSKQFVSNDLMLMFRNILDRIAQNTLAKDDDIIDRADIRVVGISARDKLKSKDTSFTNVVNRDEVHYLPVEPDKKYCGLYLRFDQLGDTIRDISWWGHTVTIEGHPRPHRASVSLYKSGMQTSASPGSLDLEFNLCNNADGSASKDLAYIADHSMLRFNNAVNGFSFYIYISLADLALQSSLNPILITKRDDANYGYIVFCSPNTIHFHVYNNGNWYREKITTGVVTDSYLHIVGTFDKSGSPDSAKIKLYIEATEGGVDDSATSVLLPDTLETKLFLFARAERNVFTKCRTLIMMFWKDKILSQTEVTNLNNNNVTTLAITGNRVFTFPFSPLDLP